MKQIPVGARGRFTLVVKPEHLANRFKDAMLPPVLATPVMVMAMENAALNAIKAYLEPGESAVGTGVDIVHLAPTPVGASIVAAPAVGVETLLSSRKPIRNERRKQSSGNAKPISICVLIKRLRSG